MAPALEDLRDRALEAIERRETVVCDVASETGQIIGNVCHMRWFRLAVMSELAASTRTYCGIEVVDGHRRLSAAGQLGGTFRVTLIALSGDRKPMMLSLGKK